MTGRGAKSAGIKGWQVVIYKGDKAIQTFPLRKRKAEVEKEWDLQARWCGRFPDAGFEVRIEEVVK